MRIRQINSAPWEWHQIKSRLVPGMIVVGAHQFHFWSHWIMEHFGWEGSSRSIQFQPMGRGTFHYPRLSLGKVGPESRLRPLWGTWGNWQGGLMSITQKLNYSVRKMTLSNPVNSRIILTRNADCKEIKEKVLFQSRPEILTRFPSWAVKRGDSFSKQYKPLGAINLPEGNLLSP